MGKLDWQKALDTFAGGASESGGAIWGIFGQDVITDREAELQSQKMALDAEIAKAEAAKEQALYAALAGKGAGAGPAAAGGGRSGGVVQRPRPAGMPLARSSSSTLEPKTLLLIGGAALVLYLVVKK